MARTWRPRLAPAVAEPAHHPRTPQRQRAGVAPRLVLLAAGALCLLAGLNAALERLGLWAPVSPQALPADLAAGSALSVSAAAPGLAARLASLHGPLMLVGFMGTVISLERAVASRHAWAYLSPAASAAGCLLIAAGAPVVIGQLLVTAGALGLVAVYATVYRRAASVALDVEATGGLALLLGDLLWLAAPDDVSQAVPLWLAFVVLTVVGERLELARVAFLDAAVEEWVRLLAVGVVLAGAGLRLWPGAHLLLGAGLAALAVTMAYYDVARRTVRARGGVRLAAASMLGGYVWLGVGGVVWALQALEGAAYEIVIHCVSLGFAFSMIIAHAPTIVPAVVHRRLPYHWLMWIPLVLLHAGLVVRVLALAAGLLVPRQVGGALGVAAILSFLAVSLVRAVRGAPPQSPRGAQR